ncbi:hypothetical protein HYU07_02650 [Candidatus Woesearchaeota archaeon]|nr:hypothetical protein [Candidatus Woesearchaeota archaeon]
MNMKNLILLWLIASVIISGCQQKTGNSKVLDDPQKECARAGGEWKALPDGCVDSCFKARSKEPVFCTAVLTDGCDCGADRCWNGKTCEVN